MFSIAFKQIVSTCITKTDLVLPPRMFFQRTLCTSNVLSSRVSQKNRMQELDLTEGMALSNDPEDLGRVVEIDLKDLQEEKDYNRPKKGRKKNGTKATKSDKIEVEEINEFEDKIGAKHTQKFQDLRKLNTTSFGTVMTMLKSKKGREKTGQIFLEGKRLIYDAIKAGHKPLRVYFSRPSDLEKLDLPEDVELFRVPYKKLQFWSDVVTSQGIIGIFKLPNLAASKEGTISIPLTIVCDNVREPSNLGSILRVVSSVGCEKLILTQGCVDIWEPKVLRSAAGAHFHLPILRSIPWKEIDEEISESYKIVLASCGSSETLNNNHSTFTTSSETSDSLPLKCYSSVNYGSQKTAIIIGGETHGLSSEAVEFAKKRKGLRVFIPMSNQVESLNNAVALGILSYMVRYQYETPERSSPVEKENNTDSTEKSEL